MGILHRLRGKPNPIRLSMEKECQICSEVLPVFVCWRCREYICINCLSKDVTHCKICYEKVKEK